LGVTLAAAIHAPPAAAQGSCSETKLTAGDAECGDYFGSVALDGDTLAVGAFFDDHAFSDAGSAYVFRKIGSQWVEQQKLVAPDAFEDDLFGSPLALQGNTLLVGAFRHAHPFLDRIGAVYAFVWNGSSWVFQQELLAGDPQLLGNFGISVALRGDVAAIGSSHDQLGGGDESGAVYVFRRSNGVWTQEQKVLASDTAPFGHFGLSVALQDDLLYSNGAGFLYVFHWTGFTWVEVQKLIVSDQATGGYLNTIAVRDDWLISGSDSQDFHLGNSGAAYVFHREGGAWIERQKLFPSDPAANGYFGRSVVMGPTFALIGASEGASVPGQDLMYAFRREGDLWVETRTLRGSDSPLNLLHDGYGFFASVSQCTVAIGAPGDTGACPPENSSLSPGKAYVYEIQGCLPCIPALSTWGVLALTFLLIGFGTVLATRRAAVARPACAGGTEKGESKMSAQSKALLLGTFWVFSQVLGGRALALVPRTPLDKPTEATEPADPSRIA